MKENIKWCDLRITLPFVMGQLSEKKYRQSLKI